MSRFSPAFSLLQRLGQSLMLPVSVLPAAGLVVALGRLCQGQQNANIQALGGLFYSGGLAIFEQLPVVFAIGVAIGFTGGAGAAALAALVGYFTTINVIKMASDIYHVELAINTGVFGGILVGLMTAALYNRYYQTQLMNVLGFFSGKRLIPILTVFASFFLGLVLTWTWPPIQEHIRTFGEHMAASDWGPAFYAAGKRLLIPLGLHHVYYQPFLFEFGSFTDAAGKIFHGDSTRYFAGDPTAGRFMAAEFPLMLFGLPAAALAIVLRASPKQRKAVAGVMLSAALTSIVTGITEPIEFTFIFVAPLLYVLHVVFAFFSGWLTAFFDIHLGYTFSASLIDFGLGFFNQKNGLLLFLVVGPLIAVIYFFSFYSLIGIFNFKTPGRDEGSDAESTGASNGGGNTSLNDLSIQVLEALGGAANIVQIDACITRLRLEVKDKTEVSRPELKRLGAAGVMDGPGGNLQVVFGTRSEMIKEIIKNKIKNTEPKESGLSLRSPLRGKVMALNQVPDETFADKVLGDGIAIDPSNGLVTSPVKGQVVQMFHTGHAVGLETAEGVQILIHVGIDTVKMKGEGFKALVKTGDEVQPGTPLIEFDLELVRKNAKSTITPIIITEMGTKKTMTLTSLGSIEQGQELLVLR